jgi:hypothetical protein
MVSNSDFQQSVMALLSRLKAKKEGLQKEYESRIADVDREIESVSITQRLLREPTTLEVRVSDSIGVRDTAVIPDLIGKTMRQALIIIAKRNGGIVRIVDAKPLLMGAGIIKKPKFSWGAVYTALTRSNEFEKVPGEKGTFRIVGNRAQSNLPIAS